MYRKGIRGTYSENKYFGNKSCWGLSKSVKNNIAEFLALDEMFNNFFKVEP